MALLSRKAHGVKLGHEAAATLPDGRTVEYGDVVKVPGEPGAVFKFRYARHQGAELTVFGGLPGRESMRSFRADQVGSVTANERAVGLEAEADVSTMTAGQKAAHTRRMRLAAGPGYQAKPQKAAPPATVSMTEWHAMTAGQKAAFTRRQNKLLAELATVAA